MVTIHIILCFDDILIDSFNPCNDLLPGMPYDLLFSYSQDNRSRFQSTLKSTQQNSDSRAFQQFAQIDGSFSSERSKEIRRMQIEMNRRSSESRHATRRTDPGSGQLTRAYSMESVALPNFRKTSDLSGYYTQANIPIVNDYRRVN